MSLKYHNLLDNFNDEVLAFVCKEILNNFYLVVSGNIKNLLPRLRSDRVAIR